MLTFRHAAICYIIPNTHSSCLDELERMSFWMPYHHTLFSAIPNPRKGRTHIQVCKVRICQYARDEMISFIGMFPYEEEENGKTCKKSLKCFDVVVQLAADVKRMKQ